MTDAPVDPAKKVSLDATFLSCVLVLLENFVSPVNEVTIMPPKYSPFYGKYIVSKQGNVFEGPHFHRSFTSINGQLKKQSLFIPCNEKKKYALLVVLGRKIGCWLVYTVQNNNKQNIHKSKNRKLYTT